jgi:hypothetical protein
MRVSRPAALGLALAACVAVAWAWVAVPTWHVQPFRPQTGDGMAWSFALRRWGPWATGVGAAAAVVLAALGWRATTGRLARLGFIAGVLLVLAPAWFVRQNHFEWMFAPLAEVQYATAADAGGFLADGEMVMGVGAGGDAVAFPVRQLAYHHVVNTEVADEPVVATY